ncbi:MAG: tRNA epoxyqueuosine(34) reductase QueG [Clostridiales bacterium]|nr:tRNA epoxyqueuosine(34) reductase QueG [Clostridiales bacterium]
MSELQKLLDRFQKEQTVTIGVCGAGTFDELTEVLEKRNLALEGFVEQDIARRIDPALTMPEVKSIIVLAKGYGKEYVFEKDQQLRGVLSEASVGEDYHKSLKRVLEDLTEQLNILYPEALFQSYVDTGPLVDREVAYRAGIGFYGKSGALIHPTMGPKFVIGYLLTNLLLPVNEKKTFACGNCDRCLKYCPSGAIEEGIFHMERCVSYLTQTKRLLTEEEMKWMGMNLYGCDVCQNVCPWTKREQKMQILDIDDVFPLLDEIIPMSNKEFSQRFAKTAVGWRGKKVIQRNAIVALGNSGSAEALPYLSQALKDERLLIRQTAVRAIKILDLPEGKILLKEALQREKDEKTVEMILSSILRR